MTFRGSLPGTLFAGLSLLLVAGCGGSINTDNIDPLGTDLNGTYVLTSIRSGDDTATCPGSIGTAASCTGREKIAFSSGRRYTYTYGSETQTSTYDAGVIGDIVLYGSSTNMRFAEGTVSSAKRVVEIRRQGSTLTQRYEKRD